MLTSFLDELKRRGVLRVAAAYAVVAFVVWQAAEILVPALRLPDLALTLVVVTTLLGFPVVLAVAWIFDITPGGLRRTEPSAIDGEASTRAADAALAALIVVALLVVVIVAVLVWPSPSPRLDRQRVAVAVFENQTGDAALDPVGRMAAEWITDGVTETGLVEVVDSRTCLAASQIVTQSLAAGANLVRSFGEEVGAGTLVWGSYYPQGDSIQLRAEIVDANEGNVLQSVGPVSAPVDRPEEGIELLRQRVLSALAALLDPRFADWETAPRQPVLYTAYLSYAEGTDAYMRGDFVAAAARFQHAAELDTTYVRAMLWAAQSYLIAVWATAEQAFMVRSDSLRVALSATRDRLTPYDRARLDFLVALRYRNWFASYEATRAMMDAAPGYVDARREAALAALRVNRPAEAIELLGQLDPERASLRGWGGTTFTSPRPITCLAAITTSSGSQGAGAVIAHTRLGRYWERLEPWRPWAESGSWSASSKKDPTCR
ncbi:MAG: hypothetical protein JSW46_09355 [Gemmatimonadota bacterium]|nr:MAG: hypothetical protein JSW46_09355 [Gemmatimonadota bacterium]